MNEVQIPEKLTSDIFKNGLLVSYSISFWDGKVTQDDEDIQTQKADVDSAVYERGKKLLLPSGVLNRFYSYRSRLNSVLKKFSFPVPAMRGCRFVPRTTYPHLKEFFENEIKMFIHDSELFIEKYEDYKNKQIEAFDKRYPANAGGLDKFYPSKQIIANRFEYAWVPYAWDYKAIEEVESQAKVALDKIAADVVLNASVLMRKEIEEEIQAVLRSIERGKVKVNSRTVNGLVEKIKSIKQVNVFGDQGLNDLLDETAESIRSVTSWKVEDIERTDFKADLKGIFKGIANDIEKLKEGDASSIFCERHASLEMEQSSDEENFSVTRSASL
jgi:hypothetical protein